MQIPANLVFVDMKISLVKIKFNLARLLTCTEATKVNLEARHFNFDCLFLIFLGSFGFFCFCC